MWELWSIKNPSIKYTLLVGKQYTVGRLESDIVITGDKSISRSHATLQVKHPISNVSSAHKPAVLLISDCSKFGTHIDKKRISVSSSHAVPNNGIIKFGTMDSEFKAVYRGYTVTTSCLETASKKKCKELVVQLGGHQVSDWRVGCQLLVMSNLSVTAKVICALITQYPIVTLDYLQDLVHSIEKKSARPDPVRYLPSLAESQLNPSEVSFHPNSRRRTIFQGKIFIFLSNKQFQKLNVAIELGGGTPLLLEEGTDNNDDSVLIDNQNCVMMCQPENESSQVYSQNAKTWIKHVHLVLKRNNRRMIPDSDLGYAVLYCSTEKFCNPNISADSQASQSFMDHTGVDQSANTTADIEAYPVLAANTEDPDASRGHISIRPGDVTRILRTPSPLRSEPEVKKEPVSPPPKPSSSHRGQISSSQQGQRSVKSSSPPPNMGPPSIIPSIKKERIEPDKTETSAPLNVCNTFKRKRKADENITIKEETEPANENQPGKRQRTELTTPMESSTNVNEDNEFEFKSQTQRRRRGGGPDHNTESVTIQDEGCSDNEGNEFTAPIRKRRRRGQEVIEQDSGADGDAESTPNESKSVRPDVTIEVKYDENDNTETKEESQTDDRKDFPVKTSPSKDGILLSDTAFDPNYKSRCLKTVSVSLVMPARRKPDKQRNDSPCTRWKGRVVQNFKKFRKATQTMESLPTIIGRSDMEVNNHKASKELEEYFQSARDEEADVQNTQHAIDNMFSYSHSAKTRKR